MSKTRSGGTDKEGPSRTIRRFIPSPEDVKKKGWSKTVTRLFVHTSKNAKNSSSGMFLHKLLEREFHQFHYCCTADVTRQKASEEGFRLLMGCLRLSKVTGNMLNLRNRLTRDGLTYSTVLLHAREAGGLPSTKEELEERLLKSTLSRLKDERSTDAFAMLSDVNLLLLESATSVAQQKPEVARLSMGELREKGLDDFPESARQFIVVGLRAHAEYAALSTFSKRTLTLFVDLLVNDEKNVPERYREIIHTKKDHVMSFYESDFEVVSCLYSKYNSDYEETTLARSIEMACSNLSTDDAIRIRFNPVTTSTGTPPRASPMPSAGIADNSTSAYHTPSSSPLTVSPILGASDDEDEDGKKQNEERDADPILDWDSKSTTSPRKPSSQQNSPAVPVDSWSRRRRQQRKKELDEKEIPREETGPVRDIPEATNLPKTRPTEVIVEVADDPKFNPTLTRRFESWSRRQMANERERATVYVESIKIESPPEEVHPVEDVPAAFNSFKTEPTEVVVETSKAVQFIPTLTRKKRRLPKIIVNSCEEEPTQKAPKMENSDILEQQPMQETPNNDDQMKSSGRLDSGLVEKIVKKEEQNNNENLGQPEQENPNMDEEMEDSGSLGNGPVEDPMQPQDEQNSVEGYEKDEQADDSQSRCMTLGDYFATRRTSFERILNREREYY